MVAALSTKDFVMQEMVQTAEDQPKVVEFQFLMMQMFRFPHLLER